jgi:hypothetical protein
MSDDLETCAAAFFRIKGKDVVTEKEFTMSVALEYKWVSVAEADRLLKVLISQGILTRSNGYIKPAKDLSAVRVPVAYRPSEELRKSLAGTSEVKPAKAAPEAPADIFMELIDMAVANGLPKGKFVAESNIVKKRLGVETCVAALILLRDNGIDIEGVKDRVYAQVLGK